jgi:hypothetical protein
MSSVQKHIWSCRWATKWPSWRHNKLNTVNTPTPVDTEGFTNFLSQLFQDHSVKPQSLDNLIQQRHWNTSASWLSILQCANTPNSTSVQFTSIHICIICSIFIICSIRTICSICSNCTMCDICIILIRSSGPFIHLYSPSSSSWPHARLKYHCQLSQYANNLDKLDKLDQLDRDDVYGSLNNLIINVPKTLCVALESPWINWWISKSLLVISSLISEIWTNKARYDHRGSFNNLIV